MLTSRCRPHRGKRDVAARISPVPLTVWYMTAVLCPGQKCITSEIDVSRCLRTRWRLPSTQAPYGPSMQARAVEIQVVERLRCAAVRTVHEPHTDVHGGGRGRNLGTGNGWQAWRRQAVQRARLQSTQAKAGGWARRRASARAGAATRGYCNVSTIGSVTVTPTP
ncbi:hypothetical protein DAEQUDRAFT_2473 [Daedalea quercina L-15889]|uniref:Uncharacterized protein n=1 Tax=Daedalea quercina L-15889 TaxID=1314783 RepID=A0A165UBS4_9APHY|nr:hypothetical protein DAEQUDRAFT_2473 [Daedalea quercina L-15889]